MTADRLRIVTINIWNRQGPWDRRLALLRAGLRALDPDIIGLQEVLAYPGLGDQATEIGVLPHQAYGKAMTVADGPMTMGNALLSRWPIVDSAVLPLACERGEESRSLLCARVETPRGVLPVYVTHLTWQFHMGHEREVQVREIDRAVQDRRGPDDLPALLLGDFNAEPESDEIRFLRGLSSLRGRSTYWGDCFGIRGEGAGHTFTQVNDFARALREPPRRIDYVFSRGPDRALRGEPLAARVVLDQPEDGAWPSDHFGVYAEVSW